MSELVEDANHDISEYTHEDCGLEYLSKVASVLRKLEWADCINEEDDEPSRWRSQMTFQQKILSCQCPAQARVLM